MGKPSMPLWEGRAKQTEKKPHREWADVAAPFHQFSASPSRLPRCNSSMARRIGRPDNSAAGPGYQPQAGVPYPWIGGPLSQ
jgi:hypothetical protein